LELEAGAVALGQLPKRVVDSRGGVLDAWLRVGRCASASVATVMPSLALTSPPRTEAVISERGPTFEVVRSPKWVQKTDSGSHVEILT
jgi:hypothetical protein